jgi:NADH-quinone oxidoreductase chain G
MKGGSTALQACESVGIEVPRFCYHERLSIAGNCRMCLVEIEKTPKPVASCAMPLMEGMKIYTDTPLVKKARESVLEFLLLNHPLDCPICDQGGECDLQDQALVFGSDRSRFYETKRTVEDKNYGPLVKTIMTRCIHCTRCVRFATEIAGVEDLGCTGRGNETEIGTYIGSTLNSELSGNVIDLCPVGALTAKPHAFTSRPWEIRSAHSIDPTDGLGSNIKIDFRGNEIIRILPRFQEQINEEWISDKVRFLYDGIKRQRIGNPQFRTESSLEDIIYQSRKYSDGGQSIMDSLKQITESCDPTKITTHLGGDTNLETLTIVRDFLHKLGCQNYNYRESTNITNIDESLNFRFNETIQDIESVDVCVVVNTNPRIDATILNARLRKRYLQGGFEVALISSFNNFTFPVNHIGTTLSTLGELIKGSHELCKSLTHATNPCFIVCTDNLEQQQLDLLDGQLKVVTSILGKGVVSFLSTSCNQVGAYDLGVKPTFNTTPKLQYIIDEDDSSIFSSEQTRSNFWSKLLIQNGNTKVYIGHHADLSTEIGVDFILPGATFTEERSTYINTEERSQKSRRVRKGAYDIRENWKIIKSISGNSLLDFFSYKDIYNRMSKLVPISSHVDDNCQIQAESTSNKELKLKNTCGYTQTYIPLTNKIDNYYTTSAITRASGTMAECSSVFVNRINFHE